MTLTQADLLAICDRASTLRERLSPAFRPDARDPEDEEVVSRRLTRWCDTAAGGDWQRFRLRLAADGWDLESVRRRLGPVRLAPGEPLPRWVGTLESIANRIGSGVDGSGAIFDPFLAVARDGLARAAGDDCQLLSDRALLRLQDHLRVRLSETAAATLALKFDAFRAVRYPFEEAVLFDADEPVCREFHRRMLEGEWLAVFRHFPVLARLLSTLVDFWIDFAASFLASLRRDLPAIRATFAADAEVDHLLDLEPGLSDPHRHGRAVMRLTVAPSVHLFFKPKNLEMERAWFGLLGSLNDAGWSPRFTLLKVLSHGDYGWMECAERASDGSRDPAAWQYMSGAILCLLYVLDAADFLRENVIASDNQPVLVDLEGLMQPRVRLHGPDLSRRFSESVLSTRFLPEWLARADGTVEWVGGIDAVPFGVPPQSWSGVAARVADGFRDMYRFILGRKAWLTGPEGPLNAFAVVSTRPIFQDTAVYQDLCRISLEPECLRDGVDRSIVLEALQHLPIPSTAVTAFFPRCRDEISALERLDVPSFEGATTSTELRLESSSALQEHFAEPPLDRVRARIDRLSEADLERQVTLIRDAFCFKAGVEEADAFPARDASAATIVEDEELTPAALVDAARAVLARLTADVIVTRDGAIWPIPERMFVRGRFAYRFVPSDTFLYSGNAGIALFLAAMARVDDDEDAAALARETLRSVLLFVDSPLRLQQTTIGAATGLASVAYALANAGVLLDDPRLLEAASRAARLITEERIVSDGKLDVYDGAAGAILGLLAVHRICGDPELLSRALACGEHLLAARSPSGSGHMVWKTIAGTQMSGLAHGMAGIAYALLRLFQVSARESFLQAAVEAVAFEAAAFSPEQGNWRAFGSPADEPVFRNALCHGGAGIGLARLGGLPVLQTADIRSDIAAAVRQTIQCGIDGADSLCCGTAGRLAFVSTAARDLDSPDLRRAARGIVSDLLHSRERDGFYRLQPDLPWPVENPGFFRGAAGVAYELLRFAYPDRLACVPLFEPQPS